MNGVVESSVGIQSGLSMLGVFSHASIVVKIVMLVLGASSVLSWAIIFKKHLAFRKQEREIDELEKRFSSHEGFTNLKEVVESGSGSVSRILRYGIKNARLVPHQSGGLSRFMNAETSRIIDRLDDNVELLATIGSSAPFIGLLGTVWGIVESLHAIPGEATSIAFVGPNVAEALFATAMGLLVAIPANIFYNRFTALVTKISNRLSNLIYELGTFVAEE